jgi:hypothetical protein
MSEIDGKTLEAPGLDELMVDLGSDDASKRLRAYEGLGAALRSPRSSRASALVAPRLVELMRRRAGRERGRIVLLLGLIAEMQEKEREAPAREAVRAGLPVYLDLLSSSNVEPPIAFALLYLVAQFCEDANMIREQLAARLEGLAAVGQEGRQGPPRLPETDGEWLGAALNRTRGSDAWENVAALTYLGARAEDVTNNPEEQT